MRFPIDQFFLTPDVAVVRIERHRSIGFDHFPMGAIVRFDADLANRLNVMPKPVSPEEEEIVERVIDSMPGPELGSIEGLA